MTAGKSDLKVVVVGLGTMGRGIAQVFAEADADVAVVEHMDANMDLLLQELHASGLRTRVVRASLAEALIDADLVIEAIDENMESKQALLTQISAHGTPSLVVASNTSSLSIAELGRAYGHPSQVVGLHFFNPPVRMPLVEVVRGPQTSAKTLDAVTTWIQQAGKQAVQCTDSTNFIVNRICRPFYYEAQLLLTQGVEPGAIDLVARRCLGHRVGPLETLDHSGLHTHLRSSETAERELGDRYRPIPVVRRLVRAGFTGKQVGRGFYDYAVEQPRAARERLLQHAVGARRPLAVVGPGSARYAGAGCVRVDPDIADLVVYVCDARPTDDDVRAVRALSASPSDLVVDSADGRWLHDLPAGVGWVHAHVNDSSVFVEVVDDELAAVPITTGTHALLEAVGADWVRVPALPGLIAERLQHILVNEAVTLVEEGVAEESDVDLALKLGMNHSRGAFEYLADTGASTVVASLVSMQEGFGDTRYRPVARLLRLGAGESRPAQAELSPTSIR